jgi:hypothetical protein
MLIGKLLDKHEQEFHKDFFVGEGGGEWHCPLLPPSYLRNGKCYSKYWQFNDPLQSCIDRKCSLQLKLWNIGSVASFFLHFYLECWYKGVDVVEGAGHKAKRMVLQCINGVGSNPVEGRTKILQL